MRTLPLAFTVLLAAAVALFETPTLWSQPPGFGGPGVFGGPGGPNSADIELVDDFDQDKNGRLNTEERAKARKAAQDKGSERRGRPGRQRSRPPGTQGDRVRPADVASYTENSLYDRSILRTLFLEFEGDDWEQELADFKSTDVEVPAKLTVDGAVYSDIGVSFRGASSYFMIPKGLKRSLNLSINFVHKDQRLYGYKTLNLLNCNGDESMMSSALYSSIAGHQISTPKVNFVKVVI
ncbi:MAG: CotH kinase family protein, partial [Aeoliella sp.]